MSAAPSPRRARSVYRVRRGYYAHALGRTAIVAAILVLAVTLSLAVSLHGAVTTVLVVLAAVALVGLGIIAVSVMLPPTLLQLDEQGFRAGRRYTAGRHEGSWFDVQGAASQEGPEGWVLMIAHSDGGHTAVPLSLADASAVAVEEDVRDRLNQAHGYRPMS